MGKQALPPPLADESAEMLSLSGEWPVRLRSIVIQHLEALFVLVVLAAVIAVFYFFPFKIAFLNLFYVPVLSAAYFLGRRKAVMGALLCLLSGVLFAYYRPEDFAVQGTRLNALLVLGTWGGFLILASGAVGSLQERLAKGFKETRQLYEELKRSRVAEEMKEKVEKTLYATMDPVVAKMATEGRLRIEKREISIMFTDLTSFTEYSDRHRADVVVEELNRYFGQIEPIVELYRGHIDKYMGDGIMVEFGAPVDYDRHALMAVLAGLSMQAAVKKLNLPWGMRVGIATGTAVVGMLGVRRQAYSAVGDRVNVAKRLEEIGEPSKVFIDEPTYQQVEPLVVARKLRNFGYGRKSDREVLDRIASMEERLSREQETPELLFELGKANLQLHDATSAIRYFERALALDPNSTEIKLAYADANFRRDEYESIQLKGKLHKIMVYEVIGTRDRWNDPSTIPTGIADAYASAERFIEVPKDVVTAVEALDGSIGDSRVVALLSYALADHLNLNEELKKTILLAGYLQNLGKEAVPHYILNRKGSLTEQESRLVEKHTSEGAAACRRMGYVDAHLLDIVLHHHEAWNGSGYPDRLGGDEIPVGARITAVAEAYTALTSWRPYHDAWDRRVAISEIRKGMERGRYDPKVVIPLIEMLSPNDASY